MHLIEDVLGLGCLLLAKMQEIINNNNNNKKSTTGRLSSSLNTSWLMHRLITGVSADAQKTVDST